VAMVLDDGGRIIDVAQSLGIGEGTLGNWVRLEKIERRERAGLTRDDRAELVELRKENARLRMERDLLKRATAFWVKESGQ
jgi:transposase